MLSPSWRTPTTGPSPGKSHRGSKRPDPDTGQDRPHLARALHRGMHSESRKTGSTSMTYPSRHARTAVMRSPVVRGASSGAGDTAIRAIRAPPKVRRIGTFPCGTGTYVWSRPRDSNPGPTHYEMAETRPTEPTPLRTDSVHCIWAHPDPPGRDSPGLVVGLIHAERTRLLGLPGQ